MRGKLLWRLGQLVTLVGTLLALFMFIEFLALIELLDLYPCANEFSISGIILAIVFLIYVWHRISQVWLRFALFQVKPEDKYWLIDKIRHKDSFVIPKWSEWKTKNKLFVSMWIFLFAVILFIIQQYKTNQNEKFDSLKKKTVGEIVGFSKSVKRKSVLLYADYEFSVNDELFSGKKSLGSGLFSSKQQFRGVDISVGDLFLVEYDSTDCNTNKMRLNEPRLSTKFILDSLTCEALMIKSDLKIDVKCFLDQSFDEYGFEAYSVFLNAHKSYFQDRKYNSIKFEFFMRRDKMKQISKSCSSGMNL
ncbi:MAG: hypothetical protein AB8B53_02820 [Flavobacteriales bacterium]